MEQERVKSCGIVDFEMNSRNIKQQQIFGIFSQRSNLTAAIFFKLGWNHFSR